MDVPACARPPCDWLQTLYISTGGQCSSFNPRNLGKRGCRGLHVDHWTPWTLGHSGHGGVIRLPRNRATTGAQRTSLPFGRSAANLASGTACGTARLLHHDRFHSVKKVHRRFPVLWFVRAELAACQVSALPCHRLPMSVLAASCVGAGSPTLWLH